MPRKRRPRLLLILGGAVIASVLLSACGGDSDDASPSPPTDGEIAMFTLQSDAFQNDGAIPTRYTCDGEDVSPPLSWSGAPEGTQTLALIVDDPDAPGRTFTHWVLYDLPANASSLGEGEQPAGASQGRNDFGNEGYGGPCPPPNGPHRYQFTMYALDSAVDLEPGAGKDQLLQAMDGHVIGRAELTGTYGR